jgi:hypothetical protein
MAASGLRILWPSSPSAGHGPSCRSSPTHPERCAARLGLHGVDNLLHDARRTGLDLGAVDGEGVVAAFHAASSMAAAATADSRSGSPSWSRESGPAFGSPNMPERQIRAVG